MREERPRLPTGTHPRGVSPEAVIGGALIAVGLLAMLEVGLAAFFSGCTHRERSALIGQVCTLSSVGAIATILAGLVLAAGGPRPWQARAWSAGLTLIAMTSTGIGIL